jgi:hypothetical protein
MRHQIFVRFTFGLTLAMLPGIAHGEDFYMQTDGRLIKVLSPTGQSSAIPVAPERQGIWFLDEGPNNQKQNSVQTTGAIPSESTKVSKTRMIPLPKERYTVGEARVRLEKAKAQLERDKDTMAKFKDEADPNKLELWQARIATQENIIKEKEIALRRIEDRYARKLRLERDGQLYDDQSKYYNHVGSIDDLPPK